MRLKSFITMMFASVALLVGTTSCGDDDDDEPKGGDTSVKASDLVGTWTLDDVTYVFTKDNLTISYSGDQSFNGKYTYEFSDDKNTVTLTDSKTQKKTTLEKYMSYSCIPLPLPDAKIDSALVGAWKDDSGGFLYFDDQGIMYETQKGLSFTFYNYSAEDGNINTRCYMPDETKAEISYSVNGDTLTYNGYKYTKTEASELV